MKKLTANFFAALLLIAFAVGCAAKPTVTPPPIEPPPNAAAAPTPTASPTAMPSAEPLPPAWVTVYADYITEREKSENATIDPAPLFVDLDLDGVPEVMRYNRTDGSEKWVADFTYENGKIVSVLDQDITISEFFGVVTVDGKTLWLAARYPMSLHRWPGSYQVYSLYDFADLSAITKTEVLQTEYYDLNMYMEKEQDWDFTVTRFGENVPLTDEEYQAYVDWWSSNASYDEDGEIEHNPYISYSGNTLTLPHVAAMLDEYKPTPQTVLCAYPFRNGYPEYVKASEWIIDYDAMLAILADVARAFEK
ncbi:MAG: hypothetical protein LBT12_02630 [Oscillospiraceae bacterium]|nr:hypothetical protein [Oscillospiraceae bacterium]